jgi:membrane-associated protein
MARFVPVIRTFAPVVAGVGKMDRKKFFAFNIVGGILWGGGITLLGYVFGNKVPNVEKYVIPVFVIANIITWAPVAIHLLKDPKFRKKIKSKLTRRIEIN